jgi:hypothetical protein
LIKIAPGALAHIRAYPGSIHLRIEQVQDIALATEALDAAATEIWQFEPNMVGHAIPTPDGPYLFVDGPSLTRAQLDALPTIITRRLQEVGITEAVIANFPPGGPLLGMGTDPGLAHVTRAVALRLYPPPPPARHRKEPRLGSVIRLFAMKHGGVLA